MNIPKIVAPIITEEMISPVKLAGADILYVSYANFIKDGRFSKPRLVKFIKTAHNIETPLYLYFPENIHENQLELIKTMIDELSVINIDGIMVNDYSVLEIIKNKSQKQLRFNIHLDSGLDIHNISSCELFKKWKAKSINITEEVYLKNVTRIKKYTGKTICINLNEAVWFLEYVVNWGIDLIKIEGIYNDVSKITEIIKLLSSLIIDIKKGRGLDNIQVEKLLGLVDQNKPHKHYRTDHFTRKFKDDEGNDFEFVGSIKLFNWDAEKINILKYTEKPLKIPAKQQLRVRLTRLEQLNELEKYVAKEGCNFVDIIEYGDIISPSDLAKHNYTQIIYKVKQACQRMGVKLYLTTPRILIERDIDRVADTLKYLCNKEPRPDGVVVNNLGLWKIVSNSRKLKELNIEIGYGLNIYNSKSIDFFKNISPAAGTSINNNLEPDYIKQILKNIDLKVKKITILGASKLHTSGLCPLNNDIAIVSRLQCKAPCQKAIYAIVNPSTEEMYPMVLDGFCRFHLFYSYVYDLLSRKNEYIEAGITDFIIDFTALPPEMVEPLLSRYHYTLATPESYTPIEAEVIRYKPKTLSI